MRANWLFNRVDAPATTSSTTAATPGTSSSISRGASCPWDWAHGHVGPDQWPLVLQGSQYSSPFRRLQQQTGEVSRPERRDPPHVCLDLRLKPLDAKHVRSCQPPISLPSSRWIATTVGRCRLSAPKSGHRVERVARDSESSPGCCTDTKSVLPSGVKRGLQHSAPIGAAKSSFGSARPGPSVSSP